MLSTDRCHVYFSPRDIDRICSPLTGKKSIVGIENMSPSIDIYKYKGQITTAKTLPNITPSSLNIGEVMIKSN